jgi:hypothetical protein
MDHGATASDEHTAVVVGLAADAEVDDLHLIKVGKVLGEKLYCVDDHNSYILCCSIVL